MLDVLSNSGIFIGLAVIAAVVTIIVGYFWQEPITHFLQSLAHEDTKMHIKKSSQSCWEFVRGCGWITFALLAMILSSITLIAFDYRLAAAILLVVTTVAIAGTIRQQRRQIRSTNDRICGVERSYQELAYRAESSENELAKAIIIQKRLDEYAQLHGALYQRCHALLKADSNDQLDRFLQECVDSFFQRTALVFEPVKSPVRIGVSLYHKSSKDENRLTLWNDRDVHTREIGICDFYIGPITRKTRKVDKERGLAGITFSTSATQMSRIYDQVDGSGLSTYKASNDNFYFIGNDKQDPGFRSIVTVAVPDLDDKNRAVLSIDSSEIEMFNDERAVAFAEELGRIVAIPILIRDRLRKDNQPLVR